MFLNKFLRISLLAALLSWLYLVPVAAQGAIIFSNLLSFTGTSGACPGANPYCGLAVGADGNLYGTTSAGGSNNLGTVFQLTPGGVFTSLLSFNGTNGSGPAGALTLGSNGVFYGTTAAGGISNWGTIFLVTTNGALTNLYSFTGSNSPNQGAAPGVAMVPDGTGNLFGTANFGGLTNTLYLNVSTPLGNGYGTLFQLAANGAVTVPFVFGGTNGAHPSGGLVPAKDGNFYGTTTWGGNGLTATFAGYGTVYRLGPNGTFTNLYKFTGGGDGGFVYAGLAQGADGYLYGAAFAGGSQGYGTLFKISTNGNFVLLHNFTFTDNGSPYGGLLKGSDGNFYGTAYGAYVGNGSVFQLKPDGTYTNLVFFNNANGAHPDGVLVQGPDNNFYGTTSAGGASGLGTIFRISLPMTPVIQTIAQSNGAVIFTWSAVAGQTYQPQYSTNLAQTNWNSLSKLFVAPAGLMTTTDFGASDSPERYYRVMLAP